MFKVGDKVTWSSSDKEKTGVIVAVIPADGYVAQVFPDIKKGGSAWGGGLCRNHESYIVQVKKRYYWPRVGNLRLNTQLINRPDLQPDPVKAEKAQGQWPDWMMS
jgi:hypothetical protein